MGIKNFFSGLFGKAKETASTVVDKAEEMADKAAEEIKETSAELKEKTIEGYNKAKDWTKEAVEEVKETGNELKDKTMEGYNKAKEWTKEAVEEVKETTSETVDKVQQSDIYKKASGYVDKAVDSASQMGANIVNEGKEFVSSAEEKTSDSCHERDVPCRLKQIFNSVQIFLLTP